MCVWLVYTDFIFKFEASVHAGAHVEIKEKVKPSVVVCGNWDPGDTRGKPH